MEANGKTSDADRDDALPLVDAAAYLGVSERTLRDWRKQVESLTAIRVAVMERTGNTRRLMFPIESLRVLEMWRDKIDEADFLVRVGLRTEARAGRYEAEVVSVELLPSEEDTAEGIELYIPAPIAPQVQTHDAEIEKFMDFLAASVVQTEHNLSAADEAYIQQQRQEGMLLAARGRAAKRQGITEMERKLDEVENKARKPKGK